MLHCAELTCFETQWKFLNLRMLNDHFFVGLGWAGFLCFATLAEYS